MNLRVKPKAESGLVQHVTPESAGWTHVGFDLQRLAPGEGIGAQTGDREVCLVFVSGTGRVMVDGKDFGEIGKRMSPFEGPPEAVYVPARADWRVAAVTDVDLAVCSAPGGGEHAARVISVPAQITRGKGSNTRHTSRSPVCAPTPSPGASRCRSKPTCVHPALSGVTCWTRPLSAFGWTRSFMMSPLAVGRTPYPD